MTRRAGFGPAGLVFDACGLCVVYARQTHTAFPHLSVVIFLPFVGEHGANDVPGVFDDHLRRVDGLGAEQPSAVNRRPAEG